MGVGDGATVPKSPGPSSSEGASVGGTPVEGTSVGGSGGGVNRGCGLQAPEIEPNRSPLGTVHARPVFGPSTYQ